MTFTAIFRWIFAKIPIRKHYLLLAGSIIVGIFVFLTIFAPFIAPYHPTKYMGEGRMPPNPQHLMGTDHLGRDVLSRIIYGGRIPLIVAVASTLIALSIGSLIGWISGYRGGLLDRVLSLLMDSIYSFPSMILAIIIIAMLGPGVLNIILSIFVIYIPTYFRVVRGQVLQLKAEEFVEAARALGARDARILLKHIAPNTINSMMAISSFCIADAILTEAGLAFLGFGIPPPTPDWGFDIHKGQQFLQAGDWWMITFPGIMIILLSLGFGMIGEGISDLLNPKRKRKM
ncbi:TPA: ABC transporter permease [Candidatus Bipolaricaulota bacterium]|nr:ABC transporter permease [Candidatus Bipolaricaulota bacterium]